MGSRVAEIDQDTVAHVLGDKAIESGDDSGDRAVIGGDDLAQILGVEPRGQRGRADQIAEHHRQLPAFGLFCGSDWRRRRCGSWLTIAERRDGVDQTPAVADRRDAELAQILGRQPPQNLPVDIVVAERGRILVEPEIAQPLGHIH